MCCFRIRYAENRPTNRTTKFSLSSRARHLSMEPSTTEKTAGNFTLTNTRLVILEGFKVVHLSNMRPRNSFSTMSMILILLDYILKNKIKNSARREEVREQTESAGTTAPRYCFMICMILLSIHLSFVLPRRSLRCAHSSSSNP